MRKFKVVFSSFLALFLCMASSLCSFAATPVTGWDTPVYFDFEPLPVGFFDGDMTSDSQSLSINFNNLSDSESGSYSGSHSDSGSASSQGNIDYSVSFPIYNTRTNDSWSWSDGSFYNEDSLDYYLPSGIPSGDFDEYWDALSENPHGVITGSSVSTPNGGGSISGYGDDYSLTSSGSDSGSFSSSHDYSGTVTGSIAELWNTDKRWYSWWVVIGAGYVWFCTDARNTVNCYVTKSNDDTFAFTCSIDGGHRAFAVVCGSDGKVSRTVDNGPGSDGSLSRMTFASNIYSKESRQSSQSISWGFSQSDNSPGLKGFGSLTSGKTFLRTSIFGKDSLEFLNWQQLHSEISSLQSSISSSISSQTNTLVNTNTPGNFDQTSMGNTDSMLSLQDSLAAPSTDTIFSSGNTFTDGMGFWRDRMNELLFPSNSPITALTIFSLTLGLAVLIIGRRVNGGGTA